MKFGLFYLPTYLPAVCDAQTHYRGIIEQIEFADRIGIDYAWIVEHHFVRHGGCSRPTSRSSYLAGHASAIRLGTGATVCPSTIGRVAEQGATLDQSGPIRFWCRARFYSRRV
jgi:alkanesulfonate monooxygenase SsuD/methylene tetrahydromethanopterin reductase-like flavin-dependent oxidoreductase (luciferase family)